MPPPYEKLSRKVVYIQIRIGIDPFPAVSCFLHTAAMIGQQPDDVIHIDPDLGITLFLALIEYQFHTKMQMNRFDVIHIFLIGITGTAHKADEIPSLDHIAYFQPLRKGPVLLQMGIVVITP